MRYKNNHKIKYIFLAIFLLSLSSFFFLLSSFSKAVDCDDFEGELKDQCKEKERKAKVYEDLIRLKDKQENALSQQIKAIDQEQQKNESELTLTQAQLEDINKNIIRLESDIAEKEASMKTRKIVLSGLMQAYYEYDQQGLLEVALVEKDFSDIVNQADYTEQSSARVGEVLAEIQKLKNDLVRDKQVLDKKKEENENAKDELARKGLNLQYSENQKQKLLGQTQAEKEKYEELLKSIESEIDELEIAKESSVDYSKIPPAKGDYFDYPVSSIRITQAYGKTSFSKNYASGRHNGVDFAVNKAPIYAAGNGKVIGSGDNGKYAYGNWIAIDHGDGLVTLYGHLSSKSVSKGDSVKRGGKIGISGNTGFSTGPHLHFSVFVKSSYEVVQSKYVKGLMIPTGASVNPMKYL
ncbi:MAG: Peptidase protein [Patescibacteria group bacterium]|nr:Peptidase protein [Patescibacteria group bacterium]